MGDDVGDVGRSGYVGAAAVEDDVVSGRVQRLPPALPLEPPPPSPVSPGLGPLAPGHPPLARRHALNVADVEDRSDASSSSPEDGSADLGDIDDDDDKESRNLEPEVKIVPPGMMNGKMRPGKSESYGGNDTRFFEEEFSNRGPQTRRVGEHQRTSSVGPAVVQASARGKRGADRSVMSTPAWAFGSQQPPPRFPVDGLERDRRSSGVESQFQRDRLLHDDLIEEYFDNESGYETRRVTNRPRAAIRQNLTSWPAGGTLLPAAAAAADDDNHHHRQLLMDNKSGTSSSFLHRQNMRDDANNGGRNTDQEDEDFAMGGEAAEMFVGTLNGGRRGEEETPAVFFRSAAAATAAGRPPSSVAEVSAARIHAEKALSDYGGALGDRARFAIHDRRQQHLGDDSQTMSFNGRSESPLGIIEQRRILGGGGGGNASVAHHQYSVPSEIGTVVDQPVGMGMRLVRNPETSSMHSGRMTLLDGAVGGPGAEAEARAKPKKKMEPIRGLEVLDSVNMVELKRVGEEDETKEIQDLRDLSVLHGESSTLRDKFLYKVTYRAADIFCNSSGGFLDPFTVEDYSDAARPASSSAAGDNSQLHVLDDGGGTGDDAKSIAEAVLNHKALFYVTRKLRCVSAVSLGNCTTGYRMRVMDRAGRSVLEIHKPCHFVPPFLRKIVPVSVEAEIFLMNSHQQLPLPQQQTSVGASGGSFKPPTELIGVVKRRWGLGCLPTFTLVNPDGGMVARFKWRGSAGFKIKFCGQGSNGAGQLCLGSDETDMSARTILTYPGDLRGKALLLGASVFLSHYHRVGQTDPSYFASCFCNTMVL